LKIFTYIAAGCLLGLGITYIIIHFVPTDNIKELKESMLGEGVTDED